MTSPYPRKSSKFGGLFNPAPMVGYDENGPFLLYASDDGRSFTIDPEDEPIVATRRWRWMESRSTTCTYVVGYGCFILLHRQILQAPKQLTVDHRNNDGLN